MEATEMETRMITISDVCLIIIAVVVVIALFAGWNLSG